MLAYTDAQKKARLSLYIWPCMHDCTGPAMRVMDTHTDLAAVEVVSISSFLHLEF